MPPKHSSKRQQNGRQDAAFINGESDVPRDQLKKYSSELTRLQELFPGWSIDNLYIALSENQFDVEKTADQIIQGNVQQWDTVSKKKPEDKTKAKQQSRKDEAPRQGAPRSSAPKQADRQPQAKTKEPVAASADWDAETTTTAPVAEKKEETRVPSQSRPPPAPATQQQQPAPVKKSSTVSPTMSWSKVAAQGHALSQPQPAPEPVKQQPVAAEVKEAAPSHPAEPAATQEASVAPVEEPMSASAATAASAVPVEPIAEVPSYQPPAAQTVPSQPAVTTRGPRPLAPQFQLTPEQLAKLQQQLMQQQLNDQPEQTPPVSASPEVAEASDLSGKASPPSQPSTSLRSARPPSATGGVVLPRYLSATPLFSSPQFGAGQLSQGGLHFGSVVVEEEKRVELTEEKPLETNTNIPASTTRGLDSFAAFQMPQTSTIPSQPQAPQHSPFAAAQPHQAPYPPEGDVQAPRTQQPYYDYNSYGKFNQEGTSPAAAQPATGAFPMQYTTYYPPYAYYPQMAFSGKHSGGYGQQMKGFQNTAAYYGPTGGAGKSGVIPSPQSTEMPYGKAQGSFDRMNPQMYYGQPYYASRQAWSQGPWPQQQ